MFRKELQRGFMLIYSNNIAEFNQDIRKNLISDIIVNNFKSRIGKNPSPGEIAAWQNSLSRVRDLIELADLKNNYIALEYEIPYNQSRIDCLIFGKDSVGGSNIVLIELKQWSKAKEYKGSGNYEVETFTGNKEQLVPHPSQQVRGYHQYLKGFIAEFEIPPPLILFSCAYCHNYKKQGKSGLFHPIYKNIIEEYPIYCMEDTQNLASKIKKLLEAGEGFEIFNRFMRSQIRPSIKLLENVSDIVKNKPVFSLLNEQIVAKNMIWAKVRKYIKQKDKSVILVHGGPGTGKSVIAVNVLAEVAQKGKKVFYACKSKPFIEGLKHLVGNEGEILFSNLYRFVPSRVKENEFDLLLIDEAHRIEKKSNHQYTRAEDRTEMPQIEQLIRSSKISVFFIDDKQNVRSQEIGNSELIRQTAKDMGCNIEEVILYSQYRCMGSNDYLLWLESTLGYNNENRILNKNEIFDFRIFDSPQEIYKIIRKKEKAKENSARMIAGFCWPWSRELNSNGELVKDIVIGDFAMPWETHGDITRPPNGYVKWYEWAYKTEGVKQVGCIYTAQGFEFDYIGVIIGKDLVYNKETDSLKANINEIKDPMLRRAPENFEIYVKNIYRTLLSRGMKGCYVYFMDKDTERFFRSRMEMGKIPLKDIAEPISAPLEILSYIQDNEKYRTHLPVYSLKAAAGKFGDGSDVQEEGWVKVETGKRLNKKMFVAKVVGQSMEPLIPNNSYCIFKLDVVGSRQGKIVLVQHRNIEDVDTGGSYAIKKYQSEKREEKDGTWHHEKIILEPLNNDYKPIVLSNVSEDEFKVIAEFIDVL